MGLLITAHAKGLAIAVGTIWFGFVVLGIVPVIALVAASSAHGAHDFTVHPSSSPSREPESVWPPLWTWTEFFVAVAIGLAIGLLVSFMVVVSIAAIIAVLVVGIGGLLRRDRRRSALASGILLGSGGLYLYGAINTLEACLDDRCGGGNPWPLLLFAIVIVGVGLATGAMALRRTR